MEPVSFSVDAVGPSSLMLKRAAEKKQEILGQKTVDEQRESQQKLYELLPIPGDVEVLGTEEDGVPCEWIWRPECHSEKILLYLHGGGWITGNLTTARPAGALFADQMLYKVVAAEYRLAPEYPYPAGLDDCHAVYNRLLHSGFRAENIALIGDSAGGNLAFALVERLLREDRPLPCAVVGLSPVTDIGAASELVRHPMPQAYAYYGEEHRTIFSLYTDRDPEDPLLSPVNGRLGEYPPTLIHVGGDEPLAVDCAAFAKKAAAAGADVHCKIWREMFHDFSILGPTLKESRKSIEEIGLFLEKHLGRGASPRRPIEQ